MNPKRLLDRISDGVNPFVVLAWYRFGKINRLWLPLLHVLVPVGVISSPFLFGTTDPKGAALFGAMVMVWTAQILSFSVASMHMTEKDGMFRLNTMSPLARFHGNFFPQAVVLLVLWTISLPLVVVGARLGFPAGYLFRCITIPPLMILAITLAGFSFFALEKRTEKERGGIGCLLLLCVPMYVVTPVIIGIIQVEYMANSRVPPWRLPAETCGWCWLAALAIGCVAFYLVGRTNVIHNRNRPGREAALLLAVHVPAAVLQGILWNIAFY